MRKRLEHLRFPLLVFGCAASLALALPVAGSAATPRPLTPRPLQTAIIEDFLPSSADEDLALKRIHDAGATAFRTDLDWGNVAPTAKPKGFDPKDPADPAYRWADVDNRVRLLAAHGLEPILWVTDPPVWAGGGRYPSPEPKALSNFMTAAAKRYGGSFQGLPRVRFWQAWNEPNVKLFFEPRFTGTPVTSPDLYRLVVNQFAQAVHSVHADNVVIAGGLSPFAVAADIPTRTIAPLVFMRSLLCMSDGMPPTKTCDAKIHFDIWAVHPYTKGGPNTRAANAGDASLGDLGTTEDILQAAASAGIVVSSAPVGMWTTEFSWDTSPPDHKAVPVHLQSRWVSEALYEMWNAGVSLVTWLHIRDEPYPQKPVQSGLYFRGGDALSCDAPKPTLTAFRFPFVAYPQAGGRILIWGRTPSSKAGRVVIQRATAKRWRTIARLQADQFGIFTALIHKKVPRGSFLRPPLVLRSPTGCSGSAAKQAKKRRGTRIRGRYVRAVVAGAGASLPFSLASPANRIYPPFGGPP